MGTTKQIIANSERIREFSSGIYIPRFMGFIKRMSDQNDKSSSSGSEDDEGKGERFRSTVRKVSPSEQDLRKKIGYSRGDSESRSPASSPEKSRSRASSESSRSPKRR